MSAKDRNVPSKQRIFGRVVLLLVGAFTLFVCLLIVGSYWQPGYRDILPERLITVTDEAGTPLSNYDIYVYRCLRHGSRLDQSFAFRTEDNTEFYLEPERVFALKRVGGQFLAPDFYLSYESEPYWVACVNKEGYESRNYSLGNLRTHPEPHVRFSISESAVPGVKFCQLEYGDCSPCRAYDYFFYDESRYVHAACRAQERERED